MGLNRDTLISKAKTILSTTLIRSGFILDTTPSYDDLGWGFHYVKKMQRKGGLVHIIHFQPSGFETEDLFDITVNLNRWGMRYAPDPEYDDSPAQFSFVILAPCLWEEGGAMDQRWHFQSPGELEECYLDILDKLVKYGLPFLDDPDSSFETWYEKGTGRKLD